MLPPDSPQSPADNPSRRTLLRVGSGGALALLIGGIAGIVDRAGDDDATPGGSAADDAASSNDADATTSSTTTPSGSQPVEIGDLGEVDPAIVALGERVAETEGLTDAAALIADLGLSDDDGIDPLAQAAQMVRTDFAERRTLMVDGWVLAESEAKAAAVLALLCRAQATC